MIHKHSIRYQKDRMFDITDKRCLYPHILICQKYRGHLLRPLIWEELCIRACNRDVAKDKFGGPPQLNWKSYPWRRVCAYKDMHSFGLCIYHYIYKTYLWSSAGKRCIEMVGVLLVLLHDKTAQK